MLSLFGDSPNFQIKNIGTVLEVTVCWSMDIMFASFDFGIGQSCRWSLAEWWGFLQRLVSLEV